MNDGHPHPHDLHRHDDDGYSGHAELAHVRKRRFVKAAKAFAKARIDQHIHPDHYYEVAQVFDHAYAQWMEVH